MDAVSQLVRDGGDVPAVSGVAAQDIRMVVRGKRRAESAAALSGSNLSIDPALGKKLFRDRSKPRAEITEGCKNQRSRF